MSESLMTIGELAQALGPEASVKGASGIKFSSVEIDSRKVQPNGLFLPSKAKETDMILFRTLQITVQRPL